MYVLHISTGVGLLDFEDLVSRNWTIYCSPERAKSDFAVILHCFGVTTFLSCHRKNSETR